MSYSQVPMEHASPQPINQRSLLSGILKSRATRLGTLGAFVTLLLVLGLWSSSPSITRVPLSIEKDKGVSYSGPSEPNVYEDELHRPNWSYRESAVKDAFLHAYRAYERNAFPADELSPLTNKRRQNFNGWGVSAVDAMDTMLLMGHHDEFRRALKHVSSMTFDIPEPGFAHFFETTIRYLGGLLSAYALSGEHVLLQKADELGRKLLPAFKTPSGLPTFGVNTKSGRLYGGVTPPYVLLAEMASCQLEYRYLAHLTGNAEYYQVVEQINSVLQRSQNQRSEGLWSTHWETENGTQADHHFSVGAWGDSAYEYLLKQYLQTSQSEPRFKRMYLRATKGILENLLYLSPTRNLLYVTDTKKGIPSRKMEHLSYIWAAEGLAHTCWTMYGESPSGLGPEVARFDSGYSADDAKASETITDQWMTHLFSWEAEGSQGKPPGVGNLSGLARKHSGLQRDYSLVTASYLLRPETIESMYLMWKTTGDVVWRERGWTIFKAIEKHCRLRGGYASVVNIDVVDPLSPHNKTPSYALAETWKYLFLLFSPADPLPLDKWVFNTEAHPLPVFEWTPTEKKRYQIP
ncbi:mannosidase [Hysterangium stoloniferum]|nr:mannosidase [Hysterangium stoloniferum]